MFALSNRPQSIGRVLVSGIQLYLAGFPQIAFYALLAGLALLLPEALLPDLTRTEIAAKDVNKFTLVILVTVLLNITFTVATIDQYWAVAKQRGTGFVVGLRRGLSCLLPVLLASIVYGLTVVFGLLLLVVPGLILMLSLILYINLMVIDNAGPLDALRRSHRLVWGNGWRTLTVLSVPAIIIVALYLGLDAMLSTAAVLLSNLSQADFNLLALLVQALANMVVMPLFYAISLVQYHDLTLRR